MKKDEIRRRVKARKALLDSDEILQAAERVFAAVESMAAFTVAERILMYHSLPDELSTHGFIDKWNSRKQFFLPRVNGVNLEILPYDRSRMHLGAFRIEEPDGCDTVSIDNIDMVIVPGVAFDRMGNRVGRGKGYYDRLLSESRAITVGVGYDFQLIDDGIDAEDHDVRLDFMVVDGKGIIRGRTR